MFDLNKIVSAVTTAPSASFVGITDYVSSKGEISSIVGQIGVSYANAKEKALKAIGEAIEVKDFEAIEVKGICYQCPKTGEFNSRKRSWKMSPYKIKYSKNQVLEVAKEVLEGYKNAKPRKTNKVQLTDKENGLYLEGESNNINILLMVQNQTYKAIETEAHQANEGIINKPKATMPESLLKAKIRKRFEPKMKSFTIKGDNFKKLSIGGVVFE